MGAVVLFLGSALYKQEHSMVCYHFPVPQELKKQSTGSTPLYIFLFFSKKDCPSCLQKVLDVLNILSSQFCVAGIVPVEELKDEKELRQLTGALFPLYSYQEFKKYLPWHTPTLFGVSAAGKIIFVLPCISGQEDYLENFIKSIYGKLSTSLEKEFKRGK